MSQIFCGTISYAANNYQVGTFYYNTLSEAVSASYSGDTITVIASNTDTSSVTINKNLTLDTNGKTITRSSSITVNNGYILNITGSGKIIESTTEHIIKNYGKINISQATLESKLITGGNCIYNYESGIVTINSGRLITETKCIYSLGTVYINGGEIRGTRTIANDSTLFGVYQASATGSVTMSGGTIELTNTDTTYGDGAKGIFSHGASVIITGGKIIVTGGGASNCNVTSCIDINSKNETGGKLSISGSPELIATTTSSDGNVQTIRLKGNGVTVNIPLIISGGTIKALGPSGAKRNGLDINQNNGAVTITGGTIHGDGNGVVLTSLVTGIVTVGSENKVLSTTTPVISGGKYGIYSPNVFYFYNGVIKGTKSKPYYGTPTIRSGNFKIVTSGPSNNLYSSYLISNSNYQVENSYYDTLADAIYGASAGKTIKVLKSNIDTSTANINKNLILNTNGKIITCLNTITINNGYTLNIIGSGKITTSEAINTINNNGILQLTNATIENTSASNKVIYNSTTGTITINGGTVNGKAWGIDNYGSVTVNSGNVKAETSIGSHVRALYCRTGATVTVNDGLISAINNLVDTTYGANAIGGNGKKTITGGKIIASGYCAVGITNYSTDGAITTLTISGEPIITAISTVEGGYARAVQIAGIKGTPVNITTTIKGGKLTATAVNEEKAHGYYSIYNNGITKIEGGVITGQGGGIYITETGGSLTFGNASNGLNMDNPSASGGIYGIYVTDSFYFYNGVIKGANSTPYNGTPIIRNGNYEILTEGPSDNLYSSYLVTEKNYKINNDYFEKLGDAIIGATSGDVIILLKDNEDNSSVTVDKDVTLDTNGFTITRLTNTITINNGYTLDIIGTGKITTASSINTITNNGTINLTDATIANTSTRYKAIYNNVSGKLTINSGTIIGKAYGIDTFGVVNLKGGMVKAESSYDDWVRALYTRKGAIVTMSGGTIVSNNTLTETTYGATGLGGTGKKIITGGIINVNGYKAYAVDTYSAETLETSITISGSPTIIANSTVKGGYSRGIIVHVADNITIDLAMNISGGTITATAVTATNARGIYIIGNTGNMTITKGSIFSDGYGIHLNDSTTGQLIIGDSNSILSKVSPLVSGGTYGIYTTNGFSFNNGVIKGMQVTPYNGTPTVRSSNYEVIVTGPEDGIYSAYLKAINENGIITKWLIPVDVDNTMSSNGIPNTTIILPILSSETNNYTVNWGDGTSNSYTSEEFPTHTYTNTEEKIYEIIVSGTIKTFGYTGYENPTDSNIYSDYYTFTQYLSTIEQWGEVGAEQYGFSNCINLKIVSKNVSENTFANVKNMDYMFYNCNSVTGLDLSMWNTSNVDTMNNMFHNSINLRSILLGEKFDKLIGTSLFENCLSLSAIITQKDVETIDEIITLGENTGLQNESLKNVVLYVPNESSELIYESSSIFLSVFGIDRIEPMLEMLGNSLEKVYLNTVYDESVDAGVEVAGAKKSQENEYEQYGYELVITGLPVDTTNIGEEQIVYSLNYSNSANNSELIATATRDVKIINESFLMEREAFDGTDENQIHYVIGAKRAGLTKYTSDLIKTITLVNSVEVPEGAVVSWDVSYNSGDKVVIAWLIENGTLNGKEMYDLYLGAEGVIKAPEDSWNLFGRYSNCTSINNLKLLYTNNVTNMRAMFYDCYSLVDLEIGELNTSKAKDMYGMFHNCKKLKSINVSNFDTSNVIEMPFMFKGCSSLESLDLDKWDTSNVTNMRSLFHTCELLTKLNIEGWNTSNVSNMITMFYGCISLSELNINNWNTSKVTSMNAMFYNCQELSNLKIMNIDTSHVTDMYGMFYNCKKLTFIDMSNWDTVSVSSMNNMFFNASSLKSILLGSNFNKLNGAEMFKGCTNLTAIIIQRDILNSGEAMVLALDTGLETQELQNINLYVPSSNAEAIYESATNYDAVVGAERIKAILQLRGNSSEKVVINSLYDEEIDAGVTVAGFDKSESVEYTQYGYSYDVEGLVLDTATTGTKEVIYTLKYEDPVDKNISEIMSVTRSVNVIDVPTIMEREIISYTDENGMEAFYPLGAYRAGLTIYKANAIKTINFVNTNEVPTGVVASWDASYTENSGTVMAWLTESSVENGVQMYNLYYGGLGGIKAPADSFRLLGSYPNCTSINNLQILDTSNCITLKAMFYNNNNLIEADVSNFDTSKVENMDMVFYCCYNIKGLDVSNWDTSKVTSMEDLFSSCYAVEELDVSEWNTINVTDMGLMFNFCKSLKALDISNFNTSNVTNMHGIFNNCIILEELDLREFDTKNVERFSCMFQGCNNLKNINLKSFNTTNATTFERMFYKSESLTSLDLSSFEINDTANTYMMFDECSNLKSILLGAGFGKIDGTNYRNISEEGTVFNNCTSLTAIITERIEPITLVGEIGLETLSNAVLYVQNKEIESVYESTTNYETVFGSKNESGDIIRVEPILKLIGSENIELRYNGTYIDEGVTVAGFEQTESGEYIQYGYNISTEKTEETSNSGSYEIVYNLTKVENINTTQIDTVKRTIIFVEGFSAPTITATLGNNRDEEYTGVTNKNIVIELTTEYPGDVLKYEWSLTSGDNFTTTNLITTNDGIGRMVLSNEMVETVYFRTVDNNNNYSEVSSIDVKIDKTSPSGSINIVPMHTDANNNKFTNTNTVTIEVEAIDNYSEESNIQVALINEADFDENNSNDEIEWISYSEQKIFELTEGAGLRKVYILVKDEAGNQSMYLAE